MWDKLREEIAVELELVNHLLETQRSILAKCSQSVPDLTEIIALASILHSFYNGIENIFKRIVKDIDRTALTGDGWHRGLLRAMTESNSNRPALLSGQMEHQLLKYLKFRHFFRNAYSFELEWKQMAPLVRGCEKTLQQLEKELLSFLAAVKDKH